MRGDSATQRKILPGFWQFVEPACFMLRYAGRVVRCLCTHCAIGAQSGRRAEGCRGCGPKKRLCERCASNGAGCEWFGWGSEGAREKGLKDFHRAEFSTELVWLTAPTTSFYLTPKTSPARYGRKEEISRRDRCRDQKFWCAWCCHFVRGRAKCARGILAHSPNGRRRIRLPWL
jgi:hypothetical protein